MNSELWPIISCVIGVFLVISVGAFCRHRDWISREADQSLAKLTANVLLPCLFVDRILWGQPMQNGSLQNGSFALLPPAWGFVTTASGFALGLMFARTLGQRIGLDTDAKQRSFALCVGICNYGYIPLPLAMEFYPNAVIDLIMHNVGVDLALWSVGILVIAGAVKDAWHRAVLSPPLLAVVTATCFKELAAAEWVPGVMRQAIAMLGDCTIPMGLLLSGAIIIDFVREANWNGAAPVVACGIALRQGIFPALMLLGGVLLPGSALTSEHSLENLHIVIMLQASMPAAIFPIVLVRLYDRDTTTALRVVLPTSIAGIILIPVWLALGHWWLNL